MVKQWIADMLVPVGNSLLSIILVVPMSVVRLIFLGVLGLLVIWIIRMPSQYPDSGRKSILSDLRLFAIGVLLLQSLFYLIF